MAGSLSSVNLIAGAGILGNVGGVALAANTVLTTDLATYANVSVVSQFANVVSTGNSVLNSSTMTALKNLSGNIFPAVTNAIPTAYISSLGNTPIGGLTSLVSEQATDIMGNGDLGKFTQVIGTAQGFVIQNNQLIASAVNANTSVDFVSADTTSTGGISDISRAFEVFGQDLAKLGNLIDFSNLVNLGDPEAVLKQLVASSSPVPEVNTALLNAGLTQNTIDNIGIVAMTPTEQKLAYQAMTQVTGFGLSQVLRVLNVTTAGIGTMADLLNPVKLFPNSFQTLTVLTVNGLRGIYVDNIGTVNSLLLTELPPSVLAPLQGNPLQNITVNAL